MADGIITPEARVSFATLITPKAFTDQSGNAQGDPKYSVTLIFEKGTDLSALKAAVKDAAKKKFGDQLKVMMENGKFRSPFRTDGAEFGYPDGSTFIRASTQFKPGCAGRYKDKTGKPPLLSDAEVQQLFYSGARVRASVKPFAYDRFGNRGVSFALGNLQWLGDGDRLDNRKAATDEFTGFEDGEPAEFDGGATAGAGDDDNLMDNL